MIRYSFFALAVLATAATAIAAVAPTTGDIRNVTVIVKNQAFPVYGPITVESCIMEDCSETER